MKKKSLTTLLLTGVTAAALLTAPAHAANLQPQTEKTYMIQAEHWSREDFSQRANPAVFTEICDRALYNTLCQTMADAGTDKSAGVNCAYTMASQANYSAAMRLVGRVYGVTRYENYTPKSVTNYYQYPSYFALAAETLEIHKAPLSSSEERDRFTGSRSCFILAGTSSCHAQQQRHCFGGDGFPEGTAGSRFNKVIHFRYTKRQASQACRFLFK